jgi:hypothetical protein
MRFGGVGSRKRSPATAFANLCKYHFRLHPWLALKWWGAMAEAEARHPHVQRVHRLIDDYRGTVQDFVAWGWRQLPPRALVEVLETLCTEALLTRQEANAIENALLPLMGADGFWKP